MGRKSHSFFLSAFSRELWLILSCSPRSIWHLSQIPLPCIPPTPIHWLGAAGERQALVMTSEHGSCWSHRSITFQIVRGLRGAILRATIISLLQWSSIFYETFTIPLQIPFTKYFINKIMAVSSTTTTLLILSHFHIQGKSLQKSCIPSQLLSHFLWLL